MTIGRMVLIPSMPPAKLSPFTRVRNQRSEPIKRLRLKPSEFFFHPMIIMKRCAWIFRKQRGLETVDMGLSMESKQTLAVSDDAVDDIGKVPVASAQTAVDDGSQIRRITSEVALHILGRCFHPCI
jgi:hypothetical protein